MFLRPACSTVIAIIGTKCSLASYTVVARKAAAGTGGAITCAFIGAFDPRMEVIGIHHVSDPSEVLGTGAQGAIWTSPFRLAIETSEAQAVVVELTGAVVGAMVLAEAALTVSSFVESYFTPCLGLVGRSSGGVATRLR